MMITESPIAKKRKKKITKSKKHYVLLSFSIQTFQVNHLISLQVSLYFSSLLYFFFFVSCFTQLQLIDEINYYMNTKVCGIILSSKEFSLYFLTFSINITESYQRKIKAALIILYVG